MELAQRVPGFHRAQMASAAYIFWLAWKVANLRLITARAVERVPGFCRAGRASAQPQGLGDDRGGLSPAFVAPGTPALQRDDRGDRLLGFWQSAAPDLDLRRGSDRRTGAGTAGGELSDVDLAGLTVASVLFVLFGGGHGMTVDNTHHAGRDRGRAVLICGPCAQADEGLIEHYAGDERVATMTSIDPASVAARHDRGLHRPRLDRIGSRMSGPWMAPNRSGTELMGVIA